MRRALDDKNYEIIKSIGKGAFGEVVLARNSTRLSMSESTDVLYAVKIISKSHVKKKPFLQKYIDQEIEIMKKLNHPNIVRYEYEFTSNPSLTQLPTSSLSSWSTVSRATSLPTRPNYLARSSLSSTL
jgi:serine/threonine protein kinase